MNPLIEVLIAAARSVALLAFKGINAAIQDEEERKKAIALLKDRLDYRVLEVEAVELLDPDALPPAPIAPGGG